MDADEIEEMLRRYNEPRCESSWGECLTWASGLVNSHLAEQPEMSRPLNERLKHADHCSTKAEEVVVRGPLRQHGRMHEDQEPLEEWARRRDARRNAAKGKLRMIPLSEGPHRGQHVDPDAPRIIQEWTGEEWETIGVVEDLAAAKAILYPPQPVTEKPAEWDRPPMAKGRGRHRKPSPAEQRDE